MEVHHNNRLKAEFYTLMWGPELFVVWFINKQPYLEGKNSDSLSVLGAFFTQVFWHF